MRPEGVRMIAVRTPSLLRERSLPSLSSFSRVAVPAALLVAIGVELAVLVAWLPDTIRYWNGPTGDFKNLYYPAVNRELPGLYSPGLIVLLHPLTYLSELNAFRALFVVNGAAMLVLAFLAQRNLQSPEARLAAALAVIALPQAHWAVRIGHLTPLLALTVVAGLMLLRSHPMRAALVLSLLSLKPQYAAAPFLFLLAKRLWRAAAVMLAASAALAAAGFAVTGPGSVREFWALALDWGPDATRNLLPVQQSWLYSWPGVQISLGMEPHRLITYDLILLSLGVSVIAWLRNDIAKGAAAAALALPLLTPYSMFYDAGLLAAAFVLILRAGLRPALAGALVAALYAAALVTMHHTIFPSPNLLGDAATNGIFILTPAMLGAVIVFAFLAGNRRRDTAEDAVGH
jgi:hypothetical protein